MRLLLIDFDDSFTYNIVAELHQLSFEVVVVNYRNLVDFWKSRDKKDVKFQALLLGPGPGHPHAYKSFFPYIKRLVIEKDLYLSGVCLGHQILMNMLGFEIIPSNAIIHGAAVNLDFSPWGREFYLVDPQMSLKQDVCRYNSLAIRDNQSLYTEKQRVIVQNGELMAYISHDITSFQFHPESVGTNCPGVFFKILKNNMYNYLYDRESQN